MRGLRKREDDKVERFFEIVQQAASKRGAVFFADAGEGRDFVTDEMEGEDISGWLIPFEEADEFEPLWKKSGWIDDDKWVDRFCFAIWSNPENPVIEFKTYD